LISGIRCGFGQTRKCLRSRIQLDYVAHHIPRPRPNSRRLESEQASLFPHSQSFYQSFYAAATSFPMW
jgi:hypothetical protein